MARLVMKFGGTSVADVDRIKIVARHVKREVDAGFEVAVVVSAMAGTTNQLVAWTRQAALLHDAREYDTVVAAGEQITSGLLAIALQELGVNARSWQGWQIPVLTDAVYSCRVVPFILSHLSKFSSDPYFFFAASSFCATFSSTLSIFNFRLAWLSSS